MATLMVLFQLDAQNFGNFRGRVSNNNGEVIPGVTIAIKGTSKGAITGANGEFQIERLEIGHYVTEISAVGFEKLEFSIEITAGKTVYKELTIKEAINSLDEVVVRGESTSSLVKKSISAIDVIDLKIEKTKSADLGQILSQTKGIAVQRSGGLGSDTRISLNGLTDDQIRYFYNGIPLDYSAFGFGIANIPVGILSRVDVYKGVVPAYLGSDALGGAFNVIPKVIPPGFDGLLSYQFGSFGTQRLEASLSYRNAKSSFLRAGFFYDFTNNNYPVFIGLPDEQGKISEREVERFHDAYQAYGATVEIGIEEKNKIELLSIEFYASANNKEIQNAQLTVIQVNDQNIITGSPVGEATNDLDVIGGNIRFKYNLSSKIGLRLNAGYNYRVSEFLDSARNFYSWFGEVLGERNGQGEIQSGSPAHQFLWTNSFFQNIGLNYRFNEKNRISAHSFGNHIFQDGEDEFGSTFLPFGNESRLDSRISSVEYTNGADEDPLNFQFFGKHYFITYQSEEPRVNSVEGTVTETNSQSNFGYGTALRYNFKNGLITKFSYEWATRLPRVEEVLGDGALIANNLQLNPERSHNTNLEVQYRKKFAGNWNWFLNPTFFWREIEDHIIFLQAPGRSSIYENVFSARSLGLEFASNITSPGNQFQIGGNFTFQNYINTSNEGIYESQEGDRIPNRPFLFANFNTSYTFQKIGKSESLLRFFSDARYVGDYFLSWESLGTRDSKQVIPEQFTINSGVAFETDLKDTRLIITGEMFNVMDARVFDFFGVQRPGRSIFVKTVISF